MDKKRKKFLCLLLVMVTLATSILGYNFSSATANSNIQGSEISSDDAEDKKTTGNIVIKDFLDFNEEYLIAYKTYNLKDAERDTMLELLPDTLKVETIDGDIVDIDVQWSSPFDMEKPYAYYLFDVVLPDQVSLSSELQEMVDNNLAVLPFVEFLFDMDGVEVSDTLDTLGDLMDMSHSEEKEVYFYEDEELEPASFDELPYMEGGLDTSSARTAVGDTVYYVKGDFISYGSDKTSYKQVTIGGKTFTAYCAETYVNAPTTGNYTASLLSSATDNVTSTTQFNKIKMLLMFGENGPYSSEAAALTGQTDKNLIYAYIHDAISYVYCGKYKGGSKTVSIVNHITTYIDGSASDSAGRLADMKNYEVFMMNFTGNGLQDVVWLEKTTIPVTINVSKTDATTGAYLTGATFELWGYDGSAYSKKIGTFTDNGNGTYKITFNNNATTISSGKYWYVIKETKAPAGYSLESANLYKDEYAAYGGRRIYFDTFGNMFSSGGSKLDSSTVINFANYPASAKLKLKKSSSDVSITDGNANYSLNGAEYGVYSDSACKKSVGTLTTGADGLSNILALNIGTYYVKEKKAPTGFQKDSTVYTVKLTSSHTSTAYLLKVSDTPITAKLRLKKTSSEPEITKDNSYYSFDGAQYGVYKDADCSVPVGTLTAESSGLSDYLTLPMGIYYVKELIAPNGFKLDPDVHMVTLTAEHSTNDSACILIVEDEPYKMVSISLGKKDAATSDALSGAEFHVYAWDGKEYSIDKGIMTETETGIYKIDFYHTDAVDGKYKVVEEKNPKGYTGIWSKEFVIDENSKEVQSLTYSATNAQTEQPFSIEVVKVDSLTDMPMSNCKFTVYEYNAKTSKYVKLGTLVWDSDSNKYVSDKNVDLKNQLIAYYGVSGNQGKFKIVETSVPDGYVQSGAWLQEFIVPENSNDTVVYEFNATNDPTRILFWKVDENGDAIVGAHLQVYDRDGELITEFDSAVEGVEVDHLNAGETYILKETVVPEGYIKADDMEFVVQDTPDVQDIVMTDKCIVTSFSKVSSIDDSVFVEGASLELRADKDDPDSVVTTVNGEKVSWVSTKEPKVFKGIPAGIYWLVETEAPIGYSVAEPVEVHVTDGLSNSAVMYDTPYAELTVVKQIKVNEINFANGNPTFIITVKGNDSAGNYHEYSEFYEFTEEYVNGNTDPNGYVSMSYTWDQIPIGNEYSVMEDGNNRYYLSAVSSKDSNVSISKLKSAKYGLTPDETFRVSVDLQAKSSGTIVTFTNSKYAWNGWGHNAIVKNKINLLK